MAKGREIWTRGREGGAADGASRLLLLLATCIETQEGA